MPEVSETTLNEYRRAYRARMEVPWKPTVLDVDPRPLYDSSEPTREDEVARGVKRTDLELEAQEIIKRLGEIISELAQDRRRLEAAKLQLLSAFPDE